jgi:hypothetical protein
MPIASLNEPGLPGRQSEGLSNIGGSFKGPCKRARSVLEIFTKEASLPEIDRPPSRCQNLANLGWKVFHPQILR